MTAYLDHAATSAIRPDCVADATARFLRECGGTPGRGGHHVAVEAGRIALRCRRALLSVLGLAGDPGRIAFMANATTALNTALMGTLGPGDVVVVTEYDHNSVRRPLAYLARTRGVEIRTVAGDPEGGLDLDEAEAKLAGAALMVVNAASNVLGNVLPLAELAERAHGAGARVLVDTAQSAGHVRMDHAAAGADLVAFTGHKGLLGPQGTGGLWVRDGLEVEPLVRGGTGGDSLSPEMPTTMPNALEAGTANAPGLAGLLAALSFLEDEGIDSIHERERRHKRLLREGLSSIAGVRVLSPSAPEGIGIVTIDSSVLDPSALADRLDREWGVMTRPGLHCAPDAHRILGTLERGALRLSVGWCTTDEEIDHACHAVEAVLASTA